VQVSGSTAWLPPAGRTAAPWGSMAGPLPWLPVALLLLGGAVAGRARRRRVTARG